MQWVPGSLSFGVKRPGRESDRSSPSSAEVKNAYSYTSTPLIRLDVGVTNTGDVSMALYLIKQRHLYLT
jgi:hypothetical protein